MFLDRQLDLHSTEIEDDAFSCCSYVSSSEDDGLSLSISSPPTFPPILAHFLGTFYRECLFKKLDLESNIDIPSSVKYIFPSSQDVFILTRNLTTTMHSPNDLISCLIVLVVVY